MKSAARPRVALVYPVFEDLSHMTLWPPLGLLYLASSLRHRLDVEAILVDRNQLLGEYGDPTEVDQQTVGKYLLSNPTG